MAQEIVVKLIVDDGQVEQATKDIQKLGGSIEKVETTSKKAGANIGESLDGATEASGNLQGGIEGAINQVVVLGKAAKTSGKAMRSALIATGIGALVVAVGLLVENWEAIGKSIGLITPTLEEQLEILKKTEATTQLRVDLLDKEIDLATKQGKATEQLQQQRINLVKIIQQQKKEQLALLESEAEELRTAGLTLTTRQKIVKAILNAGRAGLGDAYILDQQTEAAERYKEIQDLILKSKIEQIDVETKLFDLQNPDGLRPGRDAIRTATTGIQTEGIVDVGETPEVMLQKAINDELINLDDELNEYRTLQALKRADEEERREQALAQMKIQTAGNVLNALASIAKEGSAGAKAIAVAQAVLSTYQGINKALAETTDFTPTQTLRFINAAAVGVAGFANVAKILSTDSSGKSTPSFSGGGGVRGGVSAPSFNVVGTGGVTQSQFQESLQAQDTPVRAYVVSGDVTSSQEFERNVENSSSIG